ncbi:MAG: lytic transglycosylase [Deltaproteobacteria bacterium]|nr:lytic transglycosylase [Deltaproteobacteria bacterium]
MPPIDRRFAVQDRFTELRRALQFALLALPILTAPAGAVDGFSQWLAELEAEAIDRGISQTTVHSALHDIEPIPEIIDHDRDQPKKPSNFCKYLERRLTPTRIARGRRMLKEHAVLLREITATYGVPARYLVALWGLETNFGDYMGEHPVLASLATLAYDPRRGEMFREQIFAALQIIDEGHRSAEGFTGSWAGAVGLVQFMPTTFLEFAVDQDGDGRKDLWTSLPDALASAANYMKRSGWRSGESWGRRVSLPPELERDRATLKRRKPIATWEGLGVRRSDGSALPVAAIRGRIVQPLRGPGPAFLVYRNYETFLRWNNSTFFAISVGTLADELTRAAALGICGL